MMSEVLGPILFQSETRSAVLELLLVRNLSLSVSELARRSGLSVRAVAREVQHLLPTGLLSVETVGGADIVRGNPKHAGARPLRALFAVPARSPVDASQHQATRESLAFWGAPLAGTRPVRHRGLNETLLRGLEAAVHDATVLRVLPMVLARNLQGVDWVALREDARHRKLKSELGWLIELTAELLQQPALRDESAPLRDRRRSAHRYFPAVKSLYEEALAKGRSSKVALRWGFWMNMSLETFRSTLEKHGA